MRILFIMTDDYPVSGACSSILKNLINGGLGERNELIDILTARYDFEKPSCEYYGHGYIFRTIIWDRFPKKNLVLAINKNKLVGLTGIIRKAFVKLYDYFNKNSYIRPTYYKPIYNALKKTRYFEYDYIIPIGGNFNIVEAAYIFCKKYHKKLAIYQVDPCAENMGENTTTEDERRTIEKKLFSFADFIFTTPILYNHVLKIVGNNKKCISVEFPNLVCPKTNNSEVALSKTRDIMAVFCGSLYRNIRNPDFTFKVFKELTKWNIKLKLIGVNSEELSVDYKDSIECCGVLPLSDAQSEMSNASVLVNIGNSMLNQVPSKIFEYFSYGKPIINICKSRKCSSLAYMGKYPLSLNVFEDENVKVAAKRIKVFLDSSYGKKVDPELVLSIFKKSTPEYCSKQIVEVLSEKNNYD